MATSLNKVLLIGHLGKDPEIRTTQNGSIWGNFTLATTEYWLNKETNEFDSKTEWHNVVSFSEHVCKNITDYKLKKGSKVYVEGKISTRKWQDQKTGADRYSTDITVAVLIPLDAKKEEATRGAGAYSPNQNNGYSPPSNESNNQHTDDEIPF